MFGFPRQNRSARIVVPLRATSLPTLRVTPTLHPTLRLSLNGTNRPWAFICPACGRDCVGTLPSPWSPMATWEQLRPDTMKG